MKRFGEIVVFSILFVGLVGCGTWKAAPVQTAPTAGMDMKSDKDLNSVYLAPGFNFNGYEGLLISLPSTQAVFEKKEIDPEEMAVYFKSKLTEELKKLGIFKVVADENSPSANTLPRDKLLVMKIVFTEMDPGSRALRYMVGFGAGATKVQVDSEVKNCLTAEVYCRASQRRVGFMGAFGGSSKGFIHDSLEGMAKDIASFVKRVASGEKIAKLIE